jgi:hypothetical protein
MCKSHATSPPWQARLLKSDKARIINAIQTA